MNWLKSLSLESFQSSEGGLTHINRHKVEKYWDQSMEGERSIQIKESSCIAWELNKCIKNRWQCIKHWPVECRQDTFPAVNVTCLNISNFFLNWNNAYNVYRYSQFFGSIRMVSEKVLGFWVKGANWFPGKYFHICKVLGLGNSWCTQSEWYLHQILQIHLNLHLQDFVMGK